LSELIGIWIIRYFINNYRQWSTNFRIIEKAIYTSDKWCLEIDT